MSKIRGNDCADERDSQQASVDRHGFCPRQALARRLVTRRSGARGVPCQGAFRLGCFVCIVVAAATHTAEVSTTEYDSRPLEGTAPRDPCLSKRCNNIGESQPNADSHARLDCWRDGRRTRGHSHWRWPCGPGVCGSAGLTAATTARHSATARVRRHYRPVWDSTAGVAGAGTSDPR